MKIAYILPSLAHKGPILVVKDIVSQIYRRVDEIDVYYFDNIVEVEFDCPVHKIDFSTQIEFDKYDIIHSHMYRPDKYIWMNRRKIRGKTVSTMHCDPRNDLRYTYNVFISVIFRWFWLMYISRHDKIVVLTKYILESYFGRYISKDKLLYIYNGRSEEYNGDINCDDKKAIEKIREQKYKIIGANALLTKRKGFHLVISALPFLSDYVFVVVGDGKEKKNLQKLAERLKVNDKCYFFGFRKNAASYLPYYDVYAMPSISEGFGLALIEAAMQRRSCVCSDIKPFKEMFTRDEVTFFSLGNIQSLISAITEAYENRAVKGERVYKRSISNYTSEIMGNSYFHLYNAMIDGR
jgi:glycosyltransferase involved in cell wall biosynthesis